MNSRRLACPGRPAFAISKLAVLVAISCAAFGPLSIQSARAQGAPAGASASGAQSLAPMLAKVTPGVVGISIAQQEGSDNPLLKDPFFKEFFEQSGKAKAAPRAEQAEVRPAGSGVIIDAARGLVLTNNHVVHEASRVVVVLKDRRELPASVLGADPGTDVALLKIEARSLVAVPLGDADAVQVGDFVAAIGNPFGIGQTVTSGIVSAVGRGGISPEGYEEYIQTDAAINPGNSGGALINMRGELIGINTAILTGGQGNRGNIGIGFAVPVSMALEVASQIERFGEVRRGRVGIQSADVTPALVAEKRLEASEGALISKVEPNSPAQQAGLKMDDVVVKVNDRVIRSAADLRNRLALIPVGTTAQLVVLRGTTQTRIPVTIGPVPTTPPTLAQAAPAGPRSEASPPSATNWGLQVAPSNGTLAVTTVDPAGRAHALGLRAGDLILSVNRQPMQTAAALTAALSQAGDKVLSILRGDSKIRLTVR